VDDPALGRVVVSEDELHERIAGLGKEITSDYADRPPLLVGVLKGAFMFMSDLSRAIDLPVEFDFMAVSSYGSATRTSGVVRIIKDLDLDLTDRDVLIVGTSSIPDSRSRTCGRTSRRAGRARSRSARCS
jgi:hypoxanthine phosphoribosyltransferase